MSQHHFPAHSSLLGKVAVLVGFSPRFHEHFTRVIVNDEPHHSADHLASPEAVYDDLKSVGVDVPASVLDGIRKDEADFLRGAANVGRRIFEYNTRGGLVQQGTC
jgi:hypothetical protein